MQIETLEQLINLGAGRQFTVSKAHQRKARNRYSQFRHVNANMKHIFKIIFFLFIITESYAQTQSGEITLEKNISLSWTTKVFKETEHKIEVSKTEFGDNYICKIDGKPWFGSDFGMEKPRNQLTKLTLKINGKETELDVTNMFNPSFEGILSERQFSLKKEGEFYKLYSFFSDGAGTYTVHWKIVNGSSIREVISNDGKFFYWQNEK